MKFPALYRKYPESPIIETTYDVHEETIFDIKVPVPYKYVEQYSVTMDEADDTRIAAMYETMLARKGVIAVVLVNNEFISMIYPDKVYSRRVIPNEGESGEVSGIYRDYTGYNELGDHIIPIGFERTFCRTYTVLITPGRIYYNKNDHTILYQNEWKKLPESITVEEFKSKSLYKILVKTPGAKGIINLGDGKHQFLA